MAMSTAPGATSTKAGPVAAIAAPCHGCPEGAA